MAKSKDSKSKVDQVKDGEIKTDFGTDFEVFLSEMDKLKGVRTINLNAIANNAPNPCGSFLLDVDLVCPIPEGGIIEIFGDEGSCKSTLALEIVGQAVSRGKIGLYVDQEKSLQRSLVQTVRTLRPYVDAVFSDDDEARKKCPVKLVRAASGEKALEAVRRFVNIFHNSVVVVDSVDALVPESKINEEVGTASMGSHAKLMSESLRLLVDDVYKSGSTLIFINQKREKVGLVFGDPTITGGGRGLKFYAWQRIELLKPGNAQRIIDPDSQIIGHRVRYKLIKNKCAPTIGVEGDFPILYGKGIFREMELIELCTKFGIISVGGKGGGQVILPVIEDGKPKLDENDNPVVKALSRFNASRYLLLDVSLMTYLRDKLLEFMLDAKNTAIQVTDEVPDSEES